MKIYILTLSAILELVFNDAIGNYGDIKMKQKFEIESWDETPYIELENSVKYSRAKLKKKYSGTISGDGQLEYLMAYNNSGSAYFTGIEHFEGKVGKKTGTFTIAHNGFFTDGIVTSTFQIVENSQTGELASLTGEGSYKAGHSMTVEFDFIYAFTAQ